MIRDTLDIQCDACGIIRKAQKFVPYRISNLLSETINELVAEGWDFIQSGQHELKAVFCPHCVERRNKNLMMVI